MPFLLSYQCPILLFLVICCDVTITQYLKNPNEMIACYPKNTTPRFNSDFWLYDYTIYIVLYASFFSVLPSLHWFITAGSPLSDTNLIYQYTLNSYKYKNFYTFVICFRSKKVMHDDPTIFYYYLQRKKGIAFHEMSRFELQLRNISIQMKFIYSMEPFTHNVDPLSLVCVADINVAAISAAAPGFSRFFPCWCCCNAVVSARVVVIAAVIGHHICFWTIRK